MSTIVGSVLGAAPAAAHAALQGMWHGHGPGGYGMMGWGYGGWFLSWIILIIVAAVVVYLVVRASKGPGSGPRAEADATEILRQRYARGEITKEQFDEMRKVLEEHSPR
jgi:putative membrane protein